MSTNQELMINYSTGDFIYRKNDLPSFLYLIHQGSVLLSSNSNPVFDKQFFKGEFFGTIETILDKPYFYDAIAIQDSLIIQLPMKKAFELLNDDLQFRLKFTQSLASEGFVSLKHNEAITAPNTSTRCVLTLLNLAELNHRPNQSIDLNTIINSIHVEKAKFDKLIKRLDRLNLIQKTDESIKIVDIQRLRDYAVFLQQKH